MNSKALLAFVAFCALAALTASLIVGGFLYHKVAPELLPWWAIAAAFQFVVVVLNQIVKGKP